MILRHQGAVLHPRCPPRRQPTEATRTRASPPPGSRRRSHRCRRRTQGRRARPARRTLREFREPCRNVSMTLMQPGRCRLPAPVAWRGGEISPGETLILPSRSPPDLPVGWPSGCRTSRPSPGYSTLARPVSASCASAPSSVSGFLSTRRTVACGRTAAVQVPSSSGSGHPARRGLAPPKSVACRAHDVDAPFAGMRLRRSPSAALIAIGITHLSDCISVGLI